MKGRADSRNTCAEVSIAPAVTIYEHDKSVELVAEMPGLTREDIAIDVKGDMLTITGNKKGEPVPEGFTALYRERCPYEYRRSFALGYDVKRGGIAASYREGVLTVTLPRLTEEAPRKITID